MRVVTEKLLTYALGRGVEYQDMPMVRAIVRDAAADKYRFSSLVLGIVKSDPFQMNQKAVRSPSRAAAQPVSKRRHDIICSSPRSTFPGGRSCAARARRWRCRCSTRWCPAATALAQTAAAPKPRFVGLLRAARHGAGLLGARQGRRARRRAAVQLEAARAVSRITR